MPKFNKTIEELETRFEKWLFVLKNLHKLDRVPEKLKESIFLQLFETAEISKFSQQEYLEYENSLKYYRDLKNSLDTAKEEGKIEGKIEIAKEMLKNNEPIENIIKYTGLTEKEINELKQ
jgi:predicted transposase/invertase (TIGR01784 family)